MQLREDGFWNSLDDKEDDVLWVDDNDEAASDVIDDSLDDE